MSKAIAGLAAIVAALSLAATASAAQGTRTFDVVFPKTSTTYVDLGRKGYSRGDYFLSTGPVLAKLGGPRIGGLAGIWTLVSKAADNASIAIRLPGGNVYVDGSIHHAAPQSVLRVRGGTGAFSGARGTASWRYLSERSAALHFELSR